MLQAIQVGDMVEVPSEGGSTKRRKGRPAGVGHFHEENQGTHFIKVFFQSGLGMLPIPDAFGPNLGPIPSKIILRTNTGCNWEIALKEVDGRAVLNQGWPAFAIAHQLRVCYMLSFKKISQKEYRVVIFDYTCCELVAKCPQQADVFKRIDAPAHVAP